MLRDIVLYSGKSLVSSGEDWNTFMLERNAGPENVIILLEYDGPKAGVPAVVSDTDRDFLFSLPRGTEIELMVRVKE